MRKNHVILFEDPFQGPKVHSLALVRMHLLILLIFNVVVARILSALGHLGVKNQSLTPSPILPPPS